jgi:hypothetical protein
MTDNTSRTEEFNHAYACDRATVFTNTVLGIIEDAAKSAITDAIEIAIKHIKNTIGDVITDAVETALYTARAAVIDALRDEFADLTRQTVNDVNPES